MYDIVISGKCLIDGTLKETFICIQDGIISRVTYTKPSNSEYGEIFRFKRNIMIPGVIDLHTHMRDPGLTAKEDLATGTISAAFGGVTAIVDMPNTRPPTHDISTFKMKKEIAMNRSMVDFGFNLVVNHQTDPQRIGEIVDDPSFAGFKIFMGETTGSLVMDDMNKISSILDKYCESGITFSIHAEDGDHMTRLKLGREGLLRSHLMSRMGIAESSAIMKALQAARDNGHLLHFLHVSSQEGINALRGGPATSEVTPHHLLLDVKNFLNWNEVDGYGKVNPPIRTPKDRAALWEALKDGTIFTLGSDHAPHTIKEKDQEIPPSGMPGVETMLPLMLQKVKERELSLERLVELTSTNPSKRIRTDNRGGIRSGKIADIVVIDMDEQRRIRGEDLHSKCGWTAFEGMTGIFPRSVFSRGELVVENDQLCAKPGRGNPIRS
jgi:dihydroorotase